ncbi:hypothetical protein ACSBM8_12350 [Sphingomonas sp. ASY06-1R]|uniref:hypothetical protein n=1 Tax=Sphingomonas sp. ASY06-1R TaxID=3445771 RepID=UPI003FA30624
MAAGPTSDEIMKAIGESGYLMEQEVATQLERRGLNVRTNVAFEDPDEAKSREIDVTAVQRVAFAESAKLAAFVELIVECKNSSNPFVFIARPKNAADRRERPQEFVFPFRYTSRKTAPEGHAIARDTHAFHHLGFDRAYAVHSASWKAVQFCRIDRKGAGWHANHGGLYDATFYPMAKALVARQKGVPKMQRDGDWAYIWLFFPIVVTSGDLILIDSSADQPAPKSVDHVSFQRDLKSGKLSGNFTVTFVRQDALEALMMQVVDPVAALARDLIENRQAFLRDTSVPWVD